MTEKKLFKLIYSIAEEAGYPVYVVGGYVRDTILKKHGGKDIDFVVVGNAMLFADKLKDELALNNIVRYARFGTFMFKYKGYQLEFVNARKESYASDSRKPETEIADLRSDLSRRDFTINTLAMDISPQSFGEIIDIFNGRNDLENKIIRTPLNPEQTFSDDPLRMMRAIRFATRLKFEIEAETFQAIEKNASRLNIISAERINDEFSKMLLTENPSQAINLLDKSNLLVQFLPEAIDMKGVDQRKDFHHKDVFNHTLQVLDNAAEQSDSLELRLAALLHDIGKPATKRFNENIGWTFHGHEVVGERLSKTILKHLKFSNEVTQTVSKLVRLHLRPMALVNDEVTDSAIRRLVYNAGDVFDNLIKLCRADITSKNPQKVKQYLKNYDRLLEKIERVEERDRIRNLQPPVRGEEIMKLFEVKPGPFIGKVKKFLLEAILEGDVANDHDSCIEYLENRREELEQM